MVRSFSSKRTVPVLVPLFILTAVPRGSPGLRSTPTTEKPSLVLPESTVMRSSGFFLLMRVTR